MNQPSRLSRLVTAIAGAVPLLIGSAAYMGNFLGKNGFLPAVNLGPGAALGLSVTGACLLGLSFGYPFMALGGILPALLGALSLLPGDTGLLDGLGLTWSIGASTCFFLSGVGITALRLLRQHKSPTLAILGSLVLALGTAALLGNSRSVVDNEEWRSLWHMEVYLALAFQSLAIALIGFSVQQLSTKLPLVPRWLPLPIAIFFGALSLLHWEMIVIENQVFLRREAEIQLSNIKHEITKTLEAANAAFSRVVEASQNWSQVNPAHHRLIQNNYLKDSPGRMRIEWLDPSGKVRWISPSTSAPDSILDEDQRRIAADRSLPDANGSSESSWVLGKDYLIYPKAFLGRRFQGTCVGIISTSRFLSGVMSRPVALESSVWILDDQDLLYSSDSGRVQDSTGAAAYDRIHLGNQTWNLHVTSSPSRIAQVQGQSSSIVLSMGVLMTLVLTLAAYLVQDASSQTVQARRTSSDLRREVKERLKTENALQRSQTQNRRLIESNMMGVIVINLEGAILDTNEAFSRLVGFSRKELLSGLSWRELTPAQHQDLDGQAIQQLNLAKVSRPWEKELYRRDGSLVPVLAGLTFVEGSKQNCICYVLDITERKDAERSLKQEHAENQRLLSAIPSILIGVDKNLQIMKWNNSAAKIFGVSSVDVQGSALQTCGIKWNVDHVIKSISAALDTAETTALLDLQFQRPDGKEGFLDLFLNPFGGGEESLSGLLIVGNEITERKVLEAQLRQAQKLESMGQLAAGIAHEINSPMQFIDTNTRYIENSFKSLGPLLQIYSALDRSGGEEQRTLGILSEFSARAKAVPVHNLIEQIPMAIQETLDGIERVSNIVVSMKSFSHPGTEEQAPADLNKSIESTITVARNEWKYVAEMVTDFDSSLPEVVCFIGEVNQVVLNLIVNASHAIEEVIEKNQGGRGKIKVSTKSLGEWAEIRVSDTGSGIPSHIQSKIFDPFFTTKEVGKGTGQGLMIAYNVVAKKHAGSLSFETEAGKGTTFIVRLPIAGKG